MLRKLVGEIGPRRWTDIAARLGGRIAKQCRERYWQLARGHFLISCC